MDLLSLFNQYYRLAQNADYLFVLALVFTAVVLTVAGACFFLLQRNVFRERLERHLGSAQNSGRVPSSLLVKDESDTGFVTRVATPLHGAVAPSNEAERTKVRGLLVQAGFRSRRAYRNYLTLRLICAISFPLAYVFVVFSYQLSVRMLLVGLVLTMAGFYLPLWGVRYLAHQRRMRIWKTLPDALDLMVVCAEAGLGLDMILRKVGEEMRPVSEDLSDEFFLTNLEIQAGKSRDEAFKNTALRTGVPEVQSLFSVLAQASRFGTSIAQTLRIHADELRLKRRQTAEERAAKLAVKMLFPMVVFIFPTIFIVLIGPAGIQMARVLFPVMSGG